MLQELNDWEKKQKNRDMVLSGMFLNFSETYTAQLLESYISE